MGLVLVPVPVRAPALVGRSVRGLEPAEAALATVWLDLEACLQAACLRATVEG